MSGVVLSRSRSTVIFSTHSLHLTRRISTWRSEQAAQCRSGLSGIAAGASSAYPPPDATCPSHSASRGPPPAHPSTVGPARPTRATAQSATPGPCRGPLPAHGPAHRPSGAAAVLLPPSPPASCAHLEDASAAPPPRPCGPRRWRGRDCRPDPTVMSSLHCPASRVYSSRSTA